MDKHTALWQGAANQDSLLQAYRKYHLLIQGLLLILGSGFTIASFAFGNSLQGWLAYSLLTAVSAVGSYMLIALNKLIISRSLDVNYFQNQILELEKSLPKNEQVLTGFKVYQKFGRGEANPGEHFLTFNIEDSIRTQLIEKHKGHTRKILDHYLFWCFLLLWILFNVVALLNMSLVAQ